MIDIPENKKLYLSPTKCISVPPYTIKNNRMIGLFGSSGSGKSSLLQYIYDEKCGKMNVHYMKQEIHLHPELTVYETIYYYCALRHKVDNKAIYEEMSNTGLDMISDQMIGSIENRGISGGEKKRIMLCVALLDKNSRLFLLDEPFSGLDELNIQTIFHLLKNKSVHSTIIMSIHYLPIILHRHLEEEWTINNSYVNYYSSLENNNDIDGFLEEEQKPSFIRQLMLLGEREYRMNKKNKWQSIMSLLIPLVTIVLQNVFIGRIHYHYKQWIHSKNDLDLLRLTTVYLISLFSVSLLPISLLSKHFAKRNIIIHEMEQGLLRKGVYLFMAITNDQIFILILAFIITCICVLPSRLFHYFLLSISLSMMQTNVLMWFLSYFISSSYQIVLLLLSSYISISFISNLGFLMREHFLSFIQYVSMIHIQTNIYFLSIRSTKYLSYFNNFEMKDMNTYIMIGIGLWCLPILLSFIGLLRNNIV